MSLATSDLDMTLAESARPPAKVPTSADPGLLLGRSVDGTCHSLEVALGKPEEPNPGSPLHSTGRELCFSLHASSATCGHASVPMRPDDNCCIL
jgi:hypothetical protein